MTNHSMTLNALLAMAAIALPAAAQVDIDLPGTTIRVGPDKGDASDSHGGVEVRAPGVDLQIPPEQRPANDAPPTEKRYLIGVAAGEMPLELRGHLGLQGVGVMVRMVTPNSAAAEVGIEKFDVLLSADGAPLASIADLAEIVEVAGPRGEAVTLKLLRRGQEITLEVTPKEQEVPVAPPLLRNDPLALPGLIDPNNGLGGGAFGFQVFGPGIAIGQGGISVQLQSVNGQQRVIAQQGDQIWELDPNDEQELAKLPPDVRRMVENTTRGGVNVGVDIGDAMQQLQGLLEQRGNANGRGLFQRFRDRRNGAPLQPANPPADGAPALDNRGGEAPIFEPGDALEDKPESIEIEIPADVGDAEPAE